MNGWVWQHLDRSDRSIHGWVAFWQYCNLSWRMAMHPWLGLERLLFATAPCTITHAQNHGLICSPVTGVHLSAAKLRITVICHCRLQRRNLSKSLSRLFFSCQVQRHALSAPLGQFLTIQVKQLWIIIVWVNVLLHVSAWCTKKTC